MAVNGTTTETVTTLASDLKLYKETTAILIGVCITLGVPALVFIFCVVKALVAHKREKRIADDEKEFQHPAPAPPLPRALLFRREGTIAGPFGNPAFDADDDDEDTGRQSGTVTPSFISTNMVAEPAFGVAPKRYQYIP